MTMQKTATQMQLIPLAEMTPTMVTNIRNATISAVVAIAAKELSKPETDLIVRDIEPYTDLGYDWSQATVSTANNWELDMTKGSVGYQSVTGASTMADQRYVAIFGVRDFRGGIGATTGATNIGGDFLPEDAISLIKFEVGGAVKAIWDTSGIKSYQQKVGFTKAFILIPQNVAFNIYYYEKAIDSVSTQLDIPAYLQLIGGTVEPRGKVIS